MRPDKESTPSVFSWPGDLKFKNPPPNTATGFLLLLLLQLRPLTPCAPCQVSPGRSEHAGVTGR